MVCSKCNKEIKFTPIILYDEPYCEECFLDECDKFVEEDEAEDILARGIL